jgi:hypothetical protein
MELKRRIAIFASMGCSAKDGARHGNAARDDPAGQRDIPPDDGHDAQHLGCSTVPRDLTRWHMLALDGGALAAPLLHGGADAHSPEGARQRDSDAPRHRGRGDRIECQLMRCNMSLPGPNRRFAAAQQGSRNGGEADGRERLPTPPSLPGTWQ